MKTMIKFIEEDDADSFARRAEMYYKKRPELMKLVEEFYRAYRALAERYDQSTVELRQAHWTMSEAIPNQIQFALPDESPSGEPRTPEMRRPARAFFDPDDSEDAYSGMGNKKGLKQLIEMLRSGVLLQKGDEGKIKRGRIVCESAVGGDSDCNSQGESESECENWKKILADAQAEKEVISPQYKQTLEKLSSLEKELNEAQKDAGSLGERASKAEIEIKILNEALTKLQAERDAVIIKHNQCLEKISDMEYTISQAKRDAEGLNEKVFEAETETGNLKAELSRLEAEKEASLLQYRQCLEVIALLENKISLAEENAKVLNLRSEKAESEVKELKEALSELKGEKNVIAVQYELCLEIIAKMESEISRGQEEAEKMKSELAEGDAKIRSMEEQRFLLQRLNESLRMEADNLVQKVAGKDDELSEKQKELEKLQTVLLEEQLRFVHVETALQTLQKLQSDSQMEQQELTLELQKRLQMVKELEICNKALEGENQSLNELNRSSTISIQNLQDEIFSLKEMKEKLEKEFSLQTDKCNILQQEVHRLKEEIEVLNRAYQALIQQLHSLGFTPECLEISVKELQNENSKLKEECWRHKGEKETLQEKLTEMDSLLENNTMLRCSVSELNGRLEGSRELVQELQKSCQFLQGDKSTLVAEKASLLSQLQIMTGNMQKFLEKNIVLENSFLRANAELEGFRAKSKSLEEFCELLKDERSNLQNERSSLISQLENVKSSLSNLEKRFIRMEEKNAVMENEKESTLSQVELLRGSLTLAQQERASYIQASESRLVLLEDLVNLLKEEMRSRKKEYDEEMDKAIKAQVEIFILQKFIKDLEEKNSSLLIECKKHVDASKLSEKLIRELESENLERQIEAEFLLDEIDKLRGMIYQIFKVLQCDPNQDLIEHVEDLKDENQKLLIENSLLVTLLGELKFESSEVELDRRAIRKECMVVKAMNDVLQKEKLELLDMNQQLMLEVDKAKLKEEALYVQLETQNQEMESMQGTILALQEENAIKCGENRLLLEKFSDLKKEMRVLEEENSSAIEEAVAFSSLSLVLERSSVEKANQVQALSEDFSNLSSVNGDLEVKIKRSEENLAKKEEENSQLKKIIEKLQTELNAEKDYNERLNVEIVTEKDLLKQKTVQLVEAERMLKAADDVRAELYRTFGGLKRENEESRDIRKDLQCQILQLSKDGNEQKRKIEDLIEANENLGSEVSLLRGKLEEQRIREESLNLELLERNNEVKLLEAEAASFYIDSQAAAIRELLLENKVGELGEDCKTLEVESAAKSVEIGSMKKKTDSLENMIGNGHSSSGLQIEKELGIDKIEVSTSNRWLRQGGAISKRFLERLATNALKLTSLQTAVRDLKKRVELSRRREKVYALEYEEVVGQLQEVEEAIMEQVNIHDQLSKDVEEVPSPLEATSTELVEVRNGKPYKGEKEQVHKGTEKIEKLQFEVQTIEYVLLKLEDEKKSTRTVVSRDDTRGVLLRDYLYGGGRKRRSKRRVKGCFGPCSRPSTRGESVD